MLAGRGLLKLQRFQFVIPRMSQSTQAHEDDLIKVERLSNGVAILRFNNPAQLNALNEKMGNVFEQKIDALKKDNSLRAVVLTGEGKGFSAGGDLEFLQQRMKTSASENSAVMRRFYQRYLSIRTLPVPTIAAINGPAVGAGFAICFACDFRIASNEAKMGFNFVRLGITPGMGSSYLLPALASRQSASLLLLTGDLISAQEALDHGLLLSVHPKDQVLAEALKIAGKIAFASPLAVRATTKTLRMQLDGQMETALMREADTQAHCYAGEDLKIGLEAVKAKKDPVFPD